MELRYVKGLSDKRIADLNKMNITTAEELVRLFPRAYLDMRNQVSLIDVQHNDFALTKATVVAIPEYVPQRAGRSVFKIMCVQDGEPFTVYWFNQPYVRAKLKEGETYLFYGRVRNRYGLSMANPTFELCDNNVNLKGIVPVYPLKGALTQRVVRNAIRDALTKVNISSVIPEHYSAVYGLSDLREAFLSVHNPQDMQEISLASERIATEEYYILISAFKFIKGDRQQLRLNRYSVTGQQLNAFSKRFGFELTNGQKAAINDIYKDLKQPVVMNRLLQGDVGCGKTAVAMCALFMAVQSGYQAALLAPTEVLAKQNYALVQRFLPEFKIGFLSGSVSASEKSATKKAIQNGEYQVVVGTHALLEDSVKFKNLSLCVCDEQQRFGVAQRNKLVQKGLEPDVLIMSATPIPRTLSLIFYGDLDISTILDKPVSRAKIQTGIVPRVKYQGMLKFVEEQIKNGRQAYFVCPKIDGNDEGAVLSVTEIYEELVKELPSVRIELLHGRMKDTKKTEIMLDFKARKIDAIVSTTVIEVGIDVPNATIMCIFSADRFGLSQLHQLRGRVGRGNESSYCFLLSDSQAETAIRRLTAIKDTDNGFEISEIDYSERGGGDFLGTRQSGKMITELGGLKYTTAAIFLAKKLSDQAFSDGSNIQMLKKVALNKYDKLKDVILN